MFAGPLLLPLLSLSLRLSLGLSGTPAPVRIERRLAAMGTALEIAVSGPDRLRALEASESAVSEIARIEDALTTWRPGGPIAALNVSLPGRPVRLSPEVASVLVSVFEWSRRTGDAFDPTVLPLVTAWGLRGSGRIPSAGDLALAHAATGTRHFRIDPAAGTGERLSASAGIDEGAWGKGYALDRAVAVLRAAGVDCAVVDLGGQVSTIGSTSVAVADPRERSRTAASIDVADSSVSTSGNSERGVTVAGRRIGHLLDPRTGQPAPDFGSVTVVAPTGFAADVLSTAFFVLGPEKGLELSERLRREGFANEALYLVVKEGGLGRLASPGMKFHIEEE